MNKIMLNSLDENYYDEQKEIIWAWNKYFWQSNVVFNNLNIEELEKTILNIELNI